jgi:hypothetical protein
MPHPHENPRLLSMWTKAETQIRNLAPLMLPERVQALAATLNATPPHPHAPPPNAPPPPPPPPPQKIPATPKLKDDPTKRDATAPTTPPEK